MPFGIPTPVLAAVGGAIVGNAITIGYQHFVGKRTTAKEWYEESITLVCKGHVICESAKRRSDIQFGNLSEESKQLSEDLYALVNPHPSNVDKEAVTKVHDLAKIFSKVHTAAETSDDGSSIESVRELLDIASWESQRNQDADMGEAVEASTEYSPTMEAIFNSLDTTPQTFGGNFRKQLNETDSMEELMRTMGHDLGVSDSKIIEKRIEEAFSNDKWDESLSIGVGATLEIASNLSLEAVNYISEVSEQHAAQIDR